MILSSPRLFSPAGNPVVPSGGSSVQAEILVKALKKDRERAIAVMEKYPSYFQERMNELLS
jgi:hypothetical protein